jgi:hypothetical protein
VRRSILLRIENLATVAAIGNIYQHETDAAWCPPSIFQMTKGIGAALLVTISNIFAPNLIVPNFKNTSMGRKACLADFGPIPFLLLLPLKMMCPNYQGNNGFPTSTPLSAHHSILALGSAPPSINDNTVNLVRTVTAQTTGPSSVKLQPSPEKIID